MRFACALFSEPFYIYYSPPTPTPCRSAYGQDRPLTEKMSFGLWLPCVGGEKKSQPGGGRALGPGDSPLPPSVLAGSLQESLGHFYSTSRPLEGASESYLFIQAVLAVTGRDPVQVGPGPGGGHTVTLLGSLAGGPC